jgi:hypothetical protein
MALTAKERITLRRSIGDYAAAEEIYGVISGGSATTLSARTSRALANAIAEHRLVASVEAALEGGTAVGGLSVEACKRMMAMKTQGEHLVTELDAIT